MTREDPQLKESPSRRRSPLTGVLAGLLILLTVGLVCELSGWRFLAHPVERLLSKTLDRQVTFGTTAADSFRLHLFGNPSLNVGTVDLANVPWSDRGPMVLASGLSLQLRYADLVKFRPGGALRVHSLKAKSLDLALQRRADGSASWQFGKQKARTREPLINGVEFGQIQVDAGTLQLRDEVSKLSLQSTFSFTDDVLIGAMDDGKTTAGDLTAQPPKTDQSKNTQGITSKQQQGIIASAHGDYHGLPVRATLRTGSVAPWLVTARNPVAVSVVTDITVGTARLQLEADVSNLIGETALQGQYKIQGPSLAAVGKPMGVTLPMTAPFTMEGSISFKGGRWETAVRQAHIARSHLAGHFIYETPAGADRPLLSGELTGPALWLQDLGPAIGAPVNPAAARGNRSQSNRRVIPDRNFDLPSLRAMNADIRIALDRLELGTSRLQAIQPMHAHLLLAGGVLKIDKIEARMARGSLLGSVTLDGQRSPALMDADLQVRGLLLEQWISQKRSAKQPPYIAGRLDGKIKVRGTGKSSAEILATGEGSARLDWTQGKISHLIVEAAGIDIAQGIGVWIKGDGALPVTCGVSDLRIHKGIVTPQLMVVDNRDSVIEMSGALSLATERLALVAQVHPKDFSPLALRAPLHIRGTLQDPAVTLDRNAILFRVVPAVLLGMVYPPAAILPFMDTGVFDNSAAERISERCRVNQRSQSAPFKSVGLD